MLNIRGRTWRPLATALLAAAILAGCQSAGPPAIEADLETSLSDVPDGQQERIRSCLDEIRKLMQETMAALQWDLAGRTVTISLRRLGANTGAETLPGAEAGHVVMRLSRSICDWPVSRRRMVIAHELDHARTMDDPAAGDGTRSRRELRAALNAATQAMDNPPPGTDNEDLKRLKREQLRAEIADLEAKIREEERAYAATDSYGPGLGIDEADLIGNRKQRPLALDTLRGILEARRKLLKTLGG